MPFPPADTNQTGEMSPPKAAVVAAKTITTSSPQVNNLVDNRHTNSINSFLLTTDGHPTTIRHTTDGHTTYTQQMLFLI